MALFPDQHSIFNISNQESFSRLALETARYQFDHNAVFNNFCRFLNRDPLRGEPVFLPVRFFKTHNVLCDNLDPRHTFLSSSTSGMGESKHLIADTSWYERSYIKGFERRFGSPETFTFLGLLPSYLERQGSSLIYMVEGLMSASASPHNGFFLNDFEALTEKILELESAKVPTILFGVTYALLDFAAKNAIPLKYTTIVETGGMKGRKQEITKSELHQRLQESFQTTQIFSEYGMTEMLSQAWTTEHGRFVAPPWMKIDITDLSDPFSILPAGSWGRICVTDLANMHSCSFIATDDIGKLHPDGSFEVAGRIDFSDLRGCSLLYI